MYTTFIRSATSFETFASAEKVRVNEFETIQEAREACADFNNNRTDAEIDAGTKMEFTSDY